MKQPVVYPGHEQPGRQEEITATDIAEGLKCGNPACSCNYEKANGWITHCPAHADENPSLSVTEGEDGKILVYCHAGCGQLEVIDELKDKGLWPSTAGSLNVVLLQSEPKGKLLEAYSYRDENERLLFQSCRYEPKGFRLRRPDDQGGWTYNLENTRLVPFNLPEVLKAELVFIVEGEKDAINLADTGLTATCNPMGALKWRPEYNQHFQGRKVVILPDNDEAGRKHAGLVARNLYGIATSLKVLELPALPEKGDVSDWLQSGGNADQLLNLVEETSDWQPNAKQSRQTKKEKLGKTPKDPSRPHLRAVGPDEEPELVSVKSVLPDAPIAEGLVVPETWARSHLAVSKINRNSGSLDLVPIASAPILISGRLVDLATGKESVRLIWPRDGEWRQHTADRNVIATRSITDLAGVGLPVNSNNAGTLINYLADFEATNLSALPRAKVSHQMGWQGKDGKLGFLWGRVLLRPDLELAEAVELDSLAPDHWQKDMIAFRGADVGDEQVADALRAAGSFEDWVRAVHQIARFPKVLLAIYCSLAAPLLKILECHNFIVDWCGRTSGGKTTTVRVGGSCWGNPDEQAEASIVATMGLHPGMDQPGQHRAAQLAPDPGRHQALQVS